MSLTGKTTGASRYWGEPVLGRVASVSLTGKTTGASRYWDESVVSTWGDWVLGRVDWTPVTQS